MLGYKTILLCVARIFLSVWPVNLALCATLLHWVKVWAQERHGCIELSGEQKNSWLCAWRVGVKKTKNWHQLESKGLFDLTPALILFVYLKAFCPTRRHWPIVCRSSLYIDFCVVLLVDYVNHLQSFVTFIFLLWFKKNRGIIVTDWYNNFILSKWNV